MAVNDKPEEGDAEGTKYESLGVGPSQDSARVKTMQKKSHAVPEQLLVDRRRLCREGPSSDINSKPKSEMNRAGFPNPLI